MITAKMQTLSLFSRKNCFLRIEFSIKPDIITAKTRIKSLFSRNS